MSSPIFESEPLSTDRPFLKDKKKGKDYEILFQDDRHLVLNKAPGVPCIPDRRDMGRPSLLDLIQPQFKTASFVHRIDVETSGLVLVALDSEALKTLSLQFEQRTIKKSYLAYVWGFAAFHHLEVDRPVGPILRKGQTVTRRKGKGAQTVFERLQTWKGFSKLLCHPITGRTHQIRIHLGDQGLPIVGDSKYGGEYPYLSKIKKSYSPSKRKTRPESPILSRCALHAFQLNYTTPDGKNLSLEAPLPKDLKQFEKQLEKYAQ